MSKHIKKYGTVTIIENQKERDFFAKVLRLWKSDTLWKDRLEHYRKRKRIYNGIKILAEIARRKRDEIWELVRKL